MSKTSAIIYVNQNSLSNYYDLHGTMWNYAGVCFGKPWLIHKTIVFDEGFGTMHKHLKYIDFSTDYETGPLLPKHIDYYHHISENNVRTLMPKYLKHMAIIDRTITPYKSVLPKTLRYFEYVCAFGIIFKLSKNIYSYKIAHDNRVIELPKHIRIIHIMSNVGRLCFPQKITTLRIMVAFFGTNCVNPIFPETLNDVTITFDPMYGRVLQFMTLGKCIFDSLPCGVSRVDYSHNCAREYKYSIDNFPNKLEHVRMSENISCSLKTSFVRADVHTWTHTYTQSDCSKLIR